MNRLRLRLSALAAFGLGCAFLVGSTTSQAKTLVSSGAPASTAAAAAGHKCVVATGSGDTAFTRNFNPFNGGSMRDFTQGGIYETLVISTAFGGGHVYNMLAKKVSFSRGGKQLNITIQPN